MIPAFEWGFMRALRPVPRVRMIQASHVIFWKRSERATQMPQNMAEKATGALVEEGVLVGFFLEGWRG